jgi:hypothetical protein
MPDPLPNLQSRDQPDPSQLPLPQPQVSDPKHTDSPDVPTDPAPPEHSEAPRSIPRRQQLLRKCNADVYGVRTPCVSLSLERSRQEFRGPNRQHLLHVCSRINV